MSALKWWRLDESGTPVPATDYRMQHFDGPPLLYETMIFGGPLEEEQERYSTRAEA